jgi:hypothetical protein
MRLQKLTPVLYVEAIEPCLWFWERLGFARTAEVPHAGRLGFVILAYGPLEVMYQTYASVQEDVPGLRIGTGDALFLEVDDLNAVIHALGGFEIAVARRKTFYGADEIFFREPGGHVIGFAQFG